MKSYYAAVSALLLVACATSRPESSAHQPEAPAISAFRDICLSSAPSFSGAAQAARAHGVTELVDMGFMQAGFNSDKSLSVQITENKECAITTPSQRVDYLTAQFLQAVADATGSPVAQGVPSKVRVGGEVFIVLYDRRGGEAFVMLKAEN